MRPARHLPSPDQLGGLEGESPKRRTESKGGRPPEAELVWLGGREAKIAPQKTVGGSSQVRTLRGELD